MLSAFLSLPIPVQISIFAVIVIPILVYWIGNLYQRLRAMRALETTMAEFERAGLGSAEGINLDALLTRQTMDSVSNNFLSQLQHDLRNRR